MDAPQESDLGNLPDASQLQSLQIDAPARPRTPSGSTVLDEGAVEEHGRTFHHYKADAYILPNDADEQSRLDLQHHVQKLLLDGDLYMAPITDPRNVLDLGTGTGIWAIEFAKQHPSCNVIGSDLSLIQPEHIVTNVSFIREDADKDEWTFNRTFDYIHARAFCGFLTDVGIMLQRAYNHLEPGGWLELQEFTHEVYPAIESMPVEDSAFKTMTRGVTTILAKSGRDPWVMQRLKDLVAEAGFVDVVQDVQHMPIGDWAADPKYREVGKWNGANMEKVLGDGRTGVMVKALVQGGMTEEEIEQLTVRALKEVRGESDPRVFAEMHYYVVLGRKPLAS